MTINAEFVIVRRSCLDLLLQHSHGCHGFSDQQRGFLRKHHIEIPRASLPDEPGSKRKTPHEPGAAERPSKERRKKKDKAKDWFLRNVPKAKQWHSKQIKIVGAVAAYEVAIRSLTDRSQVGVIKKPSQENRESEDGLVAIGVRLAALTDSSLKGEVLQKRFSYFQALVFLTYCGLLERKGFSYETVDKITQIVSSFREMDRRRLRSHALRVNTFIHELVKGGWTVYRATELFFISSSLKSCFDHRISNLCLDPLSPTYLLSINEDGFQCIHEQLTKDEYVKHDFNDCFRPQYTIPGLIAHMIQMTNTGDTLSYQPHPVIKSETDDEQDQRHICQPRIRPRYYTRIRRPHP